MKLKNYLITFYIAFLAANGFAQQGMQNKADNLFNKFSFAKASEVYEELINKGFNTDYATRQLADCYAYMRNPEKAAEYYKQVVAQENIPVEYYYKYAQSLRGVKDYIGSRNWMNTFKNAGGTINTDKLSKDADFITSVYNAKQHYFLKDVKFNSKLSDFGAYEHDKKVYFTSSIDAGVTTKHIYGWNDQPFLDVYVVDKKSDTIIHHKSKIKGDINSTYHDGPLTISKDGKTMYFCRNNSNKNGLVKDKEGISNLKIYKSSLIDGKWTNVEELSFNSDDYSIGHPALSNDGKRLYFASDMPGGIGGSDIYYVNINTDGSFGTPTNLGNIVNTDKNELFPFINNEDVLFFSSDGHLGLGLLDIFGTVSDNNNNIVSILNLGVPVNSNKDDFSFFMNDDGLTGYIASNRDGGVGDDDIYAFNRIPQLKLEGIVSDTISNEPIPNAMVTLLDNDNNEIALLKSDAKGYYQINIDRNTDYIVNAKKDNYEEQSIRVTSKGIYNRVTSITGDITLNPIPVEVEPITELYPIYFDFNKYDIRKDGTVELDRIVGLMMETYPEMVIKIESHTDSRGSDKYNYKLSVERANATYKYLISKGVDSSRITEYKGYGEERLANDCNNKSRCTEDQHQLNRRTQFIVIKIK